MGVVGDGLSTKNIFARRHLQKFLGPTHTTHFAKWVPVFVFDSPIASKIIVAKCLRTYLFYFVGDGGIEPPTSTMSM